MKKQQKIIIFAGVAGLALLLFLPKRSDAAEVAAPAPAQPKPATPFSDALADMFKPIAGYGGYDGGGIMDGVDTTPGDENDIAKSPVMQEEPIKALDPEPVLARIADPSPRRVARVSSFSSREMLR